MLGHRQPRWLTRDLNSLKRQARKDRRITLAVLAGVIAVWFRQLSPEFVAGIVAEGDKALLAISIGLAVGSGSAWLVAAYFLGLSARPRREPAEVLRWVSRISRAKEWAFCSLSAYVAWHLLQFVTALLVT
ncbi:hypothetical protein [Nonomuraea rhizosphaerae]|uniref:hypothetical protein n=1 Tax=Nonomuraea rhizosphaerae TaxID=2665663 RepID=UPI001C5F51D2|nr:hypothetical protein [Nonomuraea rhizosphaerae]